MRGLAATAAVAASLAFGTAPALAASPYVTTVGSATSGTFPVTASSTISSMFTFGSETFTCTGSSVSGSVFAGSNASTIGTITNIGWTGCTWSGAIGITITVANPVNWNINATGGNTSGSSDTITGTIDGATSTPIAAHVALNTGCAFDVIGTTAGHAQFTEANQQLKVLGTGGTLQVKNVNSAFLCMGWVSNNQAGSFEGTYSVSTGGAGNVLVG